MIRTIALGAGASVVASLFAVLAFAATKPDTFEVKRATRIQAPADRIQPLVSDFHAWSTWSPYEKMDPAMKRTFSGAPKGKGAVYAWSGNDKAGEGRMEIVAEAPGQVTIQLDFTKPFVSHNTATFRFAPQGDATEVTWAMAGPNQFIGKVMSLFMDMDQMIGKDFAAGLATMKTLAER